MVSVGVIGGYTLARTTSPSSVAPGSGAISNQQAAIAPPDNQTAAPSGSVPSGSAPSGAAPSGAAPSGKATTANLPDSGTQPSSSDPGQPLPSEQAPRTAANAPEKDTSNAAKPEDTGGTIPEDIQRSRNALRRIEVCQVRMALVNTQDDSKLNVRSEPQKADGNIIGALTNGTFLTVTGSQDRWFKISEPVGGWVAKRQTDSTCNQKVEQVMFAAGGSSLAVADRFIGTGSHRYRIGARQGQVLNLTSSNGPRPALVSPSGKVLAQLAESGQWSGKLPESGEYFVELVSNFKGYKYEFSVEILP